MIHCTHQAPTYFTYLNVAVFDFEVDSNQNGSSNAARKSLAAVSVQNVCAQTKEKRLKAFHGFEFSCSESWL